MIGIIMALYLLISGFMTSDLYLRASLFAAAGLFYIGFVNSAK